MLGRKLWTSLKFKWIRFRERKNLFEITFETGEPGIGEFITMSDGTEIRMVSESFLRDGLPTLVCYVTKEPVKLPPVKFDFISSEQPEDYPVVMGQTIWVRKGEEYQLQWQGEEYTA